MVAKELILVEPDENRNAFFKMVPDTDGRSFTVYYGRVNNSTRAMSRKYPAHHFDEVLKKKISEGYVEVATSKKAQTKSEYLFAHPGIEKLFHKLFYYSSKKIKESYEVDLNSLSDDKITKATKCIEKLSVAKDLDTFNQILVELFTVLPRKMKNVADYLAKADKDMPCILEAEQDLLAIFKTEYKKNKKETEDPSGRIDFLKQNGLIVTEATEDELDFICEKLTAESKGRLVKAYRVINKKTENAFNTYCEKYSVSGQEIKHYFHGSRNENWLNILLTGLVLNPNAIITGKMFGHGLYFAPRARKSIGYTSLDGAVWTHGNSKDGFLAIYKVAMKNPYHIYEYKNSDSHLTQQILAKQNKYSTFAHKGKSLLNDECIVYDETACTIEYLLQLK